MYDPAVQRAVLEKLARWRQLPEGDLIAMLSPVERLRFRAVVCRSRIAPGKTPRGRGG